MMAQNQNQQGGEVSQAEDSHAILAAGPESDGADEGSDLAEQIREDMQVVDASGNRVGTVDRCEDGQIKLTRADSPDGEHHFIPFDQVENVEGETVMLRKSAGDSFGQSGS
jgi:hypothetical protein